MLIIADVLTREDIARVKAGLDETPLVDGRKTAGVDARKVKANRQTDPADAKVVALARFVRQAIERHALFQTYARPAAILGPMFNAYGPGETYGLHVDETIMTKGDDRLRADFSFTLFLSDPASYEGGELVVVGNDGERSIKPEAGSMVIYSTGALHRVDPVVSGERRAAVGWIQSMIRRPDEREVLFDLARVRAALPESKARLLLDKSINNLVRIWAEL